MLDRKIQITTRSIGETQDLSQKLGGLVNQPLTIALIGDLGSGKTAFVQGLAKGLEVPDGYYITSPTFTLINEYPGRFPLVHVDLYRLESIEDLEDIGLDEMLYGQAVLAIEWADKLIGCQPAEKLLVTMEIIDDECRKLTLDATGQDEVNLIIALEDALSEQLLPSTDNSKSKRDEHRTSNVQLAKGEQALARLRRIERRMRTAEETEVEQK